MLDILSSALMIATYQRPWDKPTSRRDERSELRDQARRHHWLTLLNRGA